MMISELTKEWQDFNNQSSDFWATTVVYEICAYDEFPIQ